MIDWRTAVVEPCMAVFGEDPGQLPMYQRRTNGAPVGAAFAIQPIFDDAYRALVMQADGDPAIAAVNPVMGVSSAPFGANPPLQGDSVTVPRVGKTFVVSDVQSDGHGAIKLILEEAA